MMLLGYWAQIEPRTVIFNELNNKSSIFNYYLFKGFTLSSQNLFSSTCHATKLVYTTSLNSSATEKHMFL